MPYAGTSCVLTDRLAAYYCCRRGAQVDIQAEPPRSLVSLVPIYCIASFCLYLAGIGSFLGPYDPQESLSERLFLPVLLGVPALLLTCRLAWLMRRPKFGFEITLPLSLIAVSLGAGLVFLIFFTLFAAI